MRICTRCRHPWNLHGGGGVCLAKNCHHGPDGGPCPVFEEGETGG
jgi:hypothetical protein